MGTGEVVIRLLVPTDSMAEMTELLHRAYKVLAAMGFRYWATHQSEEDTLKRVQAGTCLVAVRSGRLVGTVTIRRGGPHEKAPEYRPEDVFIFGQFAVEPALQGTGLGAGLLARAEETARGLGGARILCDTAEGAVHLARFYEKRGYRIAGSVRWEQANYHSVILEKNLGGLDEPPTRS